MDHAVAEYNWNRYKEHIESRCTPMGHKFPGVRSIDDLVHVVYRALNDFGEDPDNAGLAKATTLRRTDEGWRLVDRHLFSFGGWFAY
jgi:hypothetical protein